MGSVVSDLHPEPLIFPRGVRLLRIDEFPEGSDEERRRLSQANITTGYVLRDGQSERFSASFEANVHAPNLWSSFRDLALAILPDIAAPILGVKDEEPALGPYTDRHEALALFEPYVDRLQHDGFLEFGIMSQHHGRTEEVFVRSAKYLQIWTNKPEAVREVFDRLEIPGRARLEFIDEYPMVSESVPDEHGNASWPMVVERLRLAFDRLPRR